MTRGRYGIDAGPEEWRYFFGDDAVYAPLMSELGWENMPPSGKDIVKFQGGAYHRKRQRLTLSIQRAGTPAPGQSKTYQAQVWCTTEKLEEALAGLPGKNYKSDRILRAYVQSGGLQTS